MFSPGGSQYRKYSSPTLHHSPPSIYLAPRPILFYDSHSTGETLSSPRNAMGCVEAHSVGTIRLLIRKGRYKTCTNGLGSARRLSPQFLDDDTSIPAALRKGAIDHLSLVLDELGSFLLALGLNLGVLAATGTSLFDAAEDDGEQGQDCNTSSGRDNDNTCRLGQSIPMSGYAMRGINLS